MAEIAVITDKFLDGNPKLGIASPNMHNVRATLVLSGWSPYFFSLESATRAETDLITFINNGIIFKNLIVVPLFGSPLNPTIQALHTIKALSDTHITYIWPDAIAPSTGKTIDELGSVVDQHIFWDTDQVKYTCSTKARMLWCPAGEHLFNNCYPYQKRSIEIGLFGSLNQPARRKIFECLSNKFKIAQIGGAREQGLGIDDYANHMKNTRICINTSLSVAGDQLKGRVFEALASGCLLFQSASAITRKYLTPDVDYIEWDTYEDCVNKLEYYTKNTLEAEQIANNGSRKFSDKYSDKRFWDLVLYN